MTEIIVSSSSPTAATDSVLRHLHKELRGRHAVHEHRSLHTVLHIHRRQQGKKWMKGCDNKVNGRIWIRRFSVIDLHQEQNNIDICLSHPRKVALNPEVSPCSNTPDSKKWLVIRLISRAVLTRWSFESFRVREGKPHRDRMNNGHMLIFRATKVSWGWHWRRAHGVTTQRKILLLKAQWEFSFQSRCSLFWSQTFLFCFS